MIRLVFILCLCYLVKGEVGSPCVRKGDPGSCVLLTDCPPAVKAFKKNRETPQICSFVGTNALVCCAGYSAGTTARPAAVMTTPKLKPTVPPVDDPPEYVALDPAAAADECEPVAATLTASKTGQKAWDKCIEYQHTLVYPCRRSASLNGGKHRASLCQHSTDDLIIGGEDASPQEFTHMVLVGYGSMPSVEWRCGGTLISDQYVLTAAHCTHKTPTYARMGFLKRSDPVDPATLRRVSKVVPHPQYKRPAWYNDIGLLRLESPVKLSENLVPACLHVPGSESRPADRALATGWGITDYERPQETIADVLQKVILDESTAQKCMETYPEEQSRRLRLGFDNATQICYGYPNKDTCKGDSGGPLQIKSKKVSCMYMVIGVTSFGNKCGVGDPGIYTRVSQYLPWIEKEVWP